jgi:hypothetical protein
MALRLCLLPALRQVATRLLAKRLFHFPHVSRWEVLKWLALQRYIVHLFGDLYFDSESRRDCLGLH